VHRLRLGDGPLALVLGVGAGLSAWSAHPPLSLGYTSIAVIPLLLAGLLGAARRHAAAPLPRLLPAGVGFVTGLATFAPMLTWLVLPAGYLAWVVLCLFLSLWYALAALVLVRWVHSGWVVLVTPVVWTGVEVLRNSIPLHGFGWGTFAYAQVDTVLLPLAGIVGGTGLTFTVALLGALLFEASRRGWMARGVGAGVRRSVALPLSGVACVLAAAVVAGAITFGEQTGTVDVLVVQGNDTEEPRYVTARERHVAIAGNMVDETRASVEAHGTPDLTIWPESAIDRDPWGSGDYLLPYLEEGARLAGGGLLAGVILDGPRPRETFRNTVLAVDEDGSVADAYVKRRLVPFGEYVPWQRLRDWVPALQQVPRDGVSEHGPRALRTPQGDVAAIICFETLFSDIVRSNLRAGSAELVVAVTNDASFGRSAEPPQHVNQSRIRAVETGRWVVHGALSGASAIIDDEGRVLAESGLFEVTSLRHEVPLIAGDTPFVRMGDVVGLITRWAVLALLVAALAGWPRSRTDLVG
jgi:apolipoprotein N-acyltransferase